LRFASILFIPLARWFRISRFCDGNVAIGRRIRNAPRWLRLIWLGRFARQMACSFAYLQHRNSCAIALLFKNGFTTVNSPFAERFARGGAYSLRSGMAAPNSDEPVA